VDNKFLLGVTKEGDRLGVCFIDTTIGEFHVGEFEDDKQFSRLSTLMSHYPPCRVSLITSQKKKKVRLLKSTEIKTQTNPF
jgi:Mismatch repair ATPase (MutS family)